MVGIRGHASGLVVHVVLLHSHAHRRHAHGVDVVHVTQAVVSHIAHVCAHLRAHPVSDKRTTPQDSLVEQAHASHGARLSAIAAAMAVLHLHVLEQLLRGLLLLLLLLLLLGMKVAESSHALRRVQVPILLSRIPHVIQRVHLLAPANASGSTRHGVSMSMSVSVSMSMSMSMKLRAYPCERQRVHMWGWTIGRGQERVEAYIVVGQSPRLLVHRGEEGRLLIDFAAHARCHDVGGVEMRLLHPGMPHHSLHLGRILPRYADPH
jgi:hypothetical protein